ncbi:MAG: translation elongation factor-like protein, partial [Planctomycetes bacterium]|nr:translation elongation factor-like protein [Planctomycetota bacterium]
MAEEHIGIVTHFFRKAHVAGIEITAGQLSVGDTIHIVGHTSDFTQQVDSIQIEHDQVQTANVGDQIGV